ncbi:MAG TPA: hypothetical protein PL185_03455, partial [Flavobacteriales bacterium]|nr:hypothetical protein [Flavobacteriales bacterium]
MKTYYKYLSGSIAALLFMAVAWSANSRPFGWVEEEFRFQPESLVGDTTDPDSLLPFPFSDDELDPLDPSPNGLFLADPSNIETTIELNPKTNEYDVNQKMGDMRYGYPSYLTFSEYQEMDFDAALQKNWRDRMASDDASKPKKGFQPKIIVPGDAFATIFGSNTIDIRPQGSAELIFGGN